MANQDVNDAKTINTITVSVSNHMTKTVFQDKIDTAFDARGIYLVYSYTKDRKNLHLQYIGKSIDLPERVTEKHEHYKDWLKAAGGKVENLSFSIISLPKYTNIMRCEAALIFALQPPINRKNKKTYDWDDLKVVFSGRKVCKKDCIVVHRTEAPKQKNEKS